MLAHFSCKVFGIDMNMLSYVTVYVWNQKWECKLWVYVVLIVHISTFYLFHFSSMIIRDLTLRSAASFGSFHLIRLLYDEYIFYLVEHRVAAATQQTPIAVMGEVRVLYESNIIFAACWTWFCIVIVEKYPFKSCLSNVDVVQGEYNSGII